MADAKGDLPARKIVLVALSYAVIVRVAKFSFSCSERQADGKLRAA
jgi:hypothetical protein